MKIESRIFGGKYFRPQPIVEIDEAQNKLILATPWGDSSFAEKAISKINEYLQASSSEADVTQHLEYIEALGPSVNRLRSALLMVNEFLFAENRKEILGVVEVLILQQEAGSISWVQVGFPNLLLVGKKSLQPFSLQMDLAEQFEMEAPLFNQALGLEKICHVQCGSIRLQPSASSTQLVLLSRSGTPVEFLQTAHLHLDSAGSVRNGLDLLSKKLVADSETKPFWLGLVQL